MNKLILCLLFTMFSLVGFSQKIYFVYLQTESEQPFFVKLNQKVHSSTGSGYLIIPRLHDSTYIFSVGFPDAKWPEQTFTVAVNHKDRGYLLKNFGDKGWGLFDLQTLSVQMSSTGKAAVDNKPAPLPGDVSPFTEILARVADDPSLKDRPVRPKPEVKKEEVVKTKEPEKKEEKTVEAVPAKTEPVQAAVVKKEEPVEIKPAVVVEQVPVKKEETVETKPVVTIDQPVAKKEESVETKPAATIEQPVVKKEAPKTEPIAINVDDKPVQPAEEKKEEKYTRSEVTKTAEAALTEGLNIVFVDKYDNGQKDTIKVIIPNPKPLVEPAKEPAKEEKKFLEINTESPKSEESKKEVTTPAVTTKVETSKPEVKNETTDKTTSEAPVKTVVNKCVSTATEGDFLKARRKMAAGETDDEMVFEARKYFKADCFSVYQIRNLSTLFLTDEGKYKFFDAAYPFASDPHNFISLQLELKDEYYVKRFKAMLK